MKQIIALIIVISLVFLSCSNSSSEEANYKINADSPVAPASMEMAKHSIVNENVTDGSEASTLKPERKRIMNAHLEITVEDIVFTEKEISRRVLDSGGWIVSSNLYWGEISLVVKVPAKSFELFISSSEKIGKVDSKSITADDVTEAYFDLKSRIENKIILHDRFKAYLEKADSMDDILSVERQLNNVTTEIEQLKRSFRGLNKDVDYSTVTFVLRPVDIKSSSNNFPSFAKAFSSLKYIVVSFIYYLVFIIIYLIILGVPIVLILGLFYVLGWGKVGLIRKFFGKLKK